MDNEELLMQTELDKSKDIFFEQFPHIKRDKKSELVYDQAFKKAWKTKNINHTPSFESDYDPGILNTWGGGNITWWHEYIRAEVERANQYWRDIVETTPTIKCDGSCQSDFECSVGASHCNCDVK